MPHSRRRLAASLTNICFVWRRDSVNAAETTARGGLCLVDMAGPETRSQARPDFDRGWIGALATSSIKLPA
jgi:hypothetical protein